MSKQQLEISFATPLRVVLEPSVPLFAVFTFTQGQFIFKGATSVAQTGQAVSTKAAATMQVGSMATLTVEWHDAGGQPAKVDGPTTWTSSDETIVQVTGGSSNPLITNIYAPGPIGVAQVQASADADMGAGVRKVSSVIEITTIAGEATAGTITFESTGTHPPSPGGPGRTGMRK
jgi:hypothetical protein